MMGWQWHQLDHMQIICTSLQTDNHASTRPMLVASEKLPVQVSLHCYARQYAACDVFPARWPKCVW